MYRQLSDFAPNINNEYSSDPLMYCVLDSMDSQFLHGPTGRTFGRYNEKCTEYISDRCAKNWDEVCEALSKDVETRFPNTGTPLKTSTGLFCNEQPQDSPCMNYGDYIIRNTAIKKYRTQIKDCNLICEPFDPTVANSPVVCYTSKYACTDKAEYCSRLNEGGLCETIISLTPEQISNLEQDPVMNKLIDNPNIGSDILSEIFLNLKREGRLDALKNTRLGRYYNYMGCNL
jgi:hypothetical protein